MSKLYFTSDWHFNHDKEFIWRARGYDSVEDMNKRQIEKYKEIITDDDVVIVLGDCFMGKDRESALAMMQELPGSKHLIYGNHDTDSKIEEYQKLRIFKSVQCSYRFKYRKKEIIVSHYPTIVTNGEDQKPVFNLCGHTHTTDPFELFEYHCYNVGVDAHNGYPICIDDILEDIYNKINEEKGMGK